MSTENGLRALITLLQDSNRDLTAERDALAEKLKEKDAELEHLRRALWLAQHPGQRAPVNTQEVGR